MRTRLLALGALLLVAAPLAAQADSLYLLGRQQLNRAEYAAAASTLARAAAEATGRRRYEAAYWRAFALYQVGDSTAMRQSATVLRQLMASPQGRAAHPDATALAARLGVLLLTIPCSNDDAADAEYLSFVATRDDDAARSTARRMLDDRSRCGPLTRQSAILLLARSPLEADRARLRSAARSDLPDAVRVEAVNGLRGDTAAATVTLLGDLLRSPGSTALTYAATNTLARLQAPGTAAEIRALLLDDSVATVARQSLLSMAVRRGAADLPDQFLRDLFDHLPSTGQSIQSTLVEAVAGRGGRTNLDWVWQVAQRNDVGALPRVTALQRVGPSRSADELATLFRDTDSRLVRYGIIEALGAQATSEARAVLRNIATTNNDTQLRDAAKMRLR